jgi:hypothetical protein
VFFVPVVNLKETPTMTNTFSLKVQASDRPTQPVGSISFCLFGEGAVLMHGAYYPSVALNRSSKVCGLR